MLKNGCGTKEEVLDKAVSMFPQASRDVNPAFFKTLEQGFSKYLIVLPKQVKLICEEDKEDQRVSESGFCLKNSLIKLIRE